MATTKLCYCAAGGNTHPSAADWVPGLLAFGAGQNLALWNPTERSHRGSTALLSGHTNTISAVRILDRHYGRYIITGSADNSIAVWNREDEGGSFKRLQVLEDHKASVTVLAVLAEQDIFVSASADGTMKAWRLDKTGARPLQTVVLKPRYLPLTCALYTLSNDSMILAVGGTSTSIQLYCSGIKIVDFQLQATLTGHEGWIRSLDFTFESATSQSDILLASASQDKFIRLWRFHSLRAIKVNGSPAAGDDLAAHIKSLSNKAHKVGKEGNQFEVTFEALLIGHEDWIYTARWAPFEIQSHTPTLLSASADNSLSMWRADETSKVWICETRLGEISAQKGSTTATGSTGGFWIGLWQPDGKGVASLGRTGTWRRWTYSEADDSWLQDLGVGGHTQEVQSCCWSPDGSYLLTTGSDQTTRMFGRWLRDGLTSWHELARPQIHGYDLNCIASLTPNQFVSGADEKLLRVFNKPQAIEKLVARLSGSQYSSNGELPDTASIPVLGLSNKAMVPNENDEEASGMPHGHGDPMPNWTNGQAPSQILDIYRPPFEEHLARHTLWPEHEKLYGHGYEISAVAAAHDGSLIATACKASSIDHAVIRLYESREWREIKPPLTAHSLTITSLAFSPNDKYLLSVSRDRGWFVFERVATHDNKYQVLCSNAKGHSRMILDCSWAPSEIGDCFATAGRDKAVKIWRLVGSVAEMVRSIATDLPVTAVSFHHTPDPGVKLAYGMEDGGITVLTLDRETLDVTFTRAIEKALAPSDTVNALRWCPLTVSNPGLYVAAVSDDHSVRIFEVVDG